MASSKSLLIGILVSSDNIAKQAVKDACDAYKKFFKGQSNSECKSEENQKHLFITIMPN